LKTSIKMAGGEYFFTKFINHNRKGVSPTFSLLTRNKAMCALVILRSPTDDSMLKSMSGIDVKPYHN